LLRRRRKPNCRFTCPRPLHETYPYQQTIHFEIYDSSHHICIFVPIQQLAQDCPEAKWRTKASQDFSNSVANLNWAHKRICQCLAKNVHSRPPFGLNPRNCGMKVGQIVSTVQLVVISLCMKPESSSLSINTLLSSGVLISRYLGPEYNFILRQGRNCTHHVVRLPSLCSFFCWHNCRLCRIAGSL
jgi:hypothetical protein